MSVERLCECHVAWSQIGFLALVVCWTALVGGCGDDVDFDEGRASELFDEVEFEISLVEHALELADEDVLALRSVRSYSFNEPVQLVSGRGELTGVLAASGWDEALVTVADQLSLAGYRLPEGCEPPDGQPSRGEWDAGFGQIDRQVSLKVTIERLSDERFAVTATIFMNLDEDLYRSAGGRCWYD